MERIIRRVLSGEGDIDRLLVVTFTNAAAAEMRERITQSGSYEEALGILGEYVNITSTTEEQGSGFEMTQRF